MKKRTISMALCATLALGQCVPVYAAGSTMAESQTSATQTALQDGVLQLSELETCVLDGSPNAQACTESLAKLNSVDREAVVKTLKDTANKLSNAIYVYGSLYSDTTALKAQQQEVADQLENYNEANYAKTYQDSLLKINSALNQVVKASQTLYLGIVKLDYGMETVQRSIDALDRAITLTRVRCSVGQASTDTLRQLQDQYTDAKSQFTALQAQSKTYKISLQSMIGMTMDGNLKVALPDTVTDDTIAAISLDSDIAAGKAASSTIYSDQKAVDDAKDDLNDAPNSPLRQHTYQQAVYTLNAAQTSFAVQATSLYHTLIENQRLYKVAQTDLTAAQKTYALAQMKYEFGSMSNLDLLTAKDALRTAEEAVELASLNLSSAYAAYSWVPLGVATS